MKLMMINFYLTSICNYNLFKFRKEFDDPSQNLERLVDEYKNQHLY